MIDIATGKTTVTVKGINSLPSWSPDSTKLVYYMRSDMRLPLPESGLTDPMQSYDIHLVDASGEGDRVISNVGPSHRRVRRA